MKSWKTFLKEAKGVHDKDEMLSYLRSKRGMNADDSVANTRSTNYAPAEEDKEVAEKDVEIDKLEYQKDELEDTVDKLAKKTKSALKKEKKQKKRVKSLKSKIEDLEDELEQAQAEEDAAAETEEPEEESPEERDEDEPETPEEGDIGYDEDLDGKVELGKGKKRADEAFTAWIEKPLPELVADLSHDVLYESGTFKNGRLAYRTHEPGKSAEAFVCRNSEGEYVLDFDGNPTKRQMVRLAESLFNHLPKHVEEVVIGGKNIRPELLEMRFIARGWRPWDADTSGERSWDATEDELKSFAMNEDNQSYFYVKPGIESIHSLVEDTYPIVPVYRRRK